MDALPQSFRLRGRKHAFEAQPDLLLGVLQVDADGEIGNRNLVGDFLPEMELAPAFVGQPIRRAHQPRMLEEVQLQRQRRPQCRAHRQHGLELLRPCGATQLGVNALFQISNPPPHRRVGAEQSPGEEHRIRAPQIPGKDPGLLAQERIC